MSDLINDLHNMADLLSAEEYSEDAERIRDAIDEIERLRAAIASSHQPQPTGTRPTGSTSAPHPVGTNR